MSLSCLIFEDSPASIAELTFLLGKYASDWNILGIGTTIEECKSLLRTHNPNIIFSDIHFDSDIIFDVLPELEIFDGDIIFISGDNGFATQAFQLSAVNYLLKPINETSFAQTLRKYDDANISKNSSPLKDILYHNLKENHIPLKKISFNTNHGYVIKELNEVIYAKSQSNYTEFFFNDKQKALVSRTMLDYEKMLEPFGFFRTHQSYLVNFNYVKRFDGEESQLHLTTDHIIPVSNRKKTVLLELLKKVF